MDGLAATRRIKAESGWNETVIVILTASVLDEDRGNVRKSGANDFLAKPCREDELLNKVSTLLSVSYDYEEIGIVDHSHGLTAAYRPESPTHVARVPQKLIEELRDATSNGDKQLLNRLIASVRQTEDTEFARDLQSLPDQYKYDALTRLLEEVW